jgi:tRNA-specific 2-thiouridylase
MGLVVAEKADSQDICFVPSGTYADIVEKFRPDALAAGEIVSEAGAVLGRHEGIARYTVGQAKRLGNAAQLAGVAQVVTRIEPASRRIVIGPRGAAGREVRLRDMNWLIEPPAEALRVGARLRARDSVHAGSVTADGVLVLDEPALAAPGQAAVFYDGSRILGGGFIV